MAVDSEDQVEIDMDADVLQAAGEMIIKWVDTVRQIMKKPYVFELTDELKDFWGVIEEPIQQLGKDIELL